MTLMTPLLRSFFHALLSQWHPRMLFITVLPFVLALALWGLALWQGLQPLIDQLHAWFSDYGLFRQSGEMLDALGLSSLRTLLVTFCEQGINYPAVPKKLIPWKNVANVIVKDNLLTIDLVSNHLIQQPIEKNSFIDEAELLAFHTHCQQQIKKA